VDLSVCTRMPGASCHVKKETNCADGLDNDNDGLADCIDPDCCSNPACSKADSCQMTPQLNLNAQLESFSAQIRSILNQIQQNARLNPSGDVSLLHGIVRDTNDFPVAGVSVSSKYGKSYSRIDGSFQLVIERTCTEVTFSRLGFRLEEEVICPSEDYFAIAPVRLSTTTETLSLRRLPPPSNLFLASDLGTRFFKRSMQSQLPVNVESGRVDFTTTLLDGTMKLRLMPMDKTSNSFFVQVIPTSEFVEVRAFCNGAAIGSRSTNKARPGVALDFEFNWNFMDIFGSQVYGLGTCEVLVGSKYLADSASFWSRATIQIAAQRPAKFKSSDFGGFRAGFDSFFHLRDNLLYEIETDTIQKIDFGHQKETVSSLAVEQVDAVHQSEREITIFSRSSGIWKMKNGKGELSRFFQALDALGFTSPRPIRTCSSPLLTESSKSSRRAIVWSSFAA
jgi:hypothetical protein